jgi:hypothetical protein
MFINFGTFGFNEPDFRSENNRNGQNNQGRGIFSQLGNFLQQ